MPYFGKTQYAVADDHGPMSKAVFHFTTHELIAVALEVGEGLVFTHDDILYMTEGVVALCRAIESLPQYLGFSMNEETVIRAIIEFRAQGSLDKEE